MGDQAMADTVLDVVDSSHASPSTDREIGETEEEPLLETATHAQTLNVPEQEVLKLLDLARRRRENKYSEWRNLKDDLLRAAEVQHGSKGSIVQDILQSEKFIPLGIEAYAALGFSYLHQAAWEGLHGIIDEIIRFEKSNGKEDPVNEFCVVTVEDEETGLQMTPLQIAAFRGHYKVVENLLKCKGVKIAGMISPNYEIEYEFTPLHLAAAGGHLKVVKLLLEKVKEFGGDSDFEEFLNSTDDIGNFSRTALHYACRNGHMEVVKELLSQEGIDKEVEDDLGYTPALLAVVAEGDNEDIVKLFLEDISDPDSPTPSFLTKHIHFSPPDLEDNLGIEYGKLPWQFILVWPNLVDSYYIDTYRYCVLPTQVKEEVDEGWKLPNEDMYFFSATRLAVLGNNGKVLECLLKRIVPRAKEDEKLIPSQSFYTGSTNVSKMINELMHYAARIGSSEALKVLLHSIEDCKLDINSERFGTTAAFSAVQNLYRFAHVKVDKEDEEYNLRLWRGILSVVNMFCLMEEFDSINRDSKDNTLLYYISETLDVLPQMHINQKKARKTCVEAAMIKLTFSSSKLNRLYEYYGDEKQNLQNGSNALLVGATLIAALAVSGMLQPPIPSGCSEGKANRAINTYWTCNSLAFYFAVYTMISCLKVLMPRRKEYIEEELKKLTQTIRLSSIGLTMTTALAVGAYIAGERLNGPSRKIAYQSTIFGLFFLVPIIFGAIGKDYWELILMLMDLSNWYDFGRACQKFYRDYHISKMLDCVYDCCLCMITFGTKRYEKVPNQAPTSATISLRVIRYRREKMERQDLNAKKEESNNNVHSRPLNIDDIDILKATCQVVFMQVILIITIVVLVLSQSAKLDSCKAFSREPYVQLQAL